MERKLRHLESTIRNRRTDKLFTDKNINPDLIKKAIDLARWEQNHHLNKP